MILPGIFLALACMAQGDVFTVSGSFGTTVYSGQLNGGSFIGTFTGTLPTAGNENLASYDLELFNSSASVVDTLTGGTAIVVVESPSTCGTVASCDAFLFPAAADGSFLELVAPLSFSGGPVFPFNSSIPAVNSFVGLLGNSGTDDSIVTSGTITGTPEPGSLSLLLLASVAMIILSRRKRLILVQRPTQDLSVRS